MTVPASSTPSRIPPGNPTPSRPATLEQPTRIWAAGRNRVGGRRVPVNPRWLLAMAILGLTALALSGLPTSPPLGRSLPADDEVLAYHVEFDRDLAIKIPIEIDAVEVSTWAAVKADGCDSAKRYPYGFIATFTDEHGKEVMRHEYDLESRISCDPERPLGEGEYAARIDQGSEAVTDPRATLLNTRDVLPQGGVLRLRAKPAVVEDGVPIELSVLSRLEGRYQRSSTSRAIFEQSLDAEERQQVARRISVLGFADLPEPARNALLTGWARRLEAAGREGKDYLVSRLLLRRFRTPYPRAEGRGAAEFVIGERHAAALNFRGPVSLDIEGPPNRKVRIADGASGVGVIDLGPGGVATVLLAREDIRTAVIDGIGPDFGVRFAVPEREATQQLGEIVHPPMPLPAGLSLPGGVRAPVPSAEARLQTPPDVRIVRYLSLHPTDPVITRVAPGQPLLGLLLRTEIEVSGGVDRGEVLAVARWGPRPVDRAEIRAPLPRSRFEWWSEGYDSSDPRLAILRIPPGVERIEITGDPRTRVRLRTIEPGVTEALYRLPYRVELREDEVWRYAPFDVTTWTDIRAVNLDDLERKERFADLREQVRIERSGAGARSDDDLPERTLTPEHAPVRRRLLMPAWQSAGEPYPGDAWTPLQVTKEVRVEGVGANAGRLNVIYRIGPGQLGQDIAVLVDGNVAVREPKVTTSGTLNVAVPEGVHTVAVEGLGALGKAYADAPPANGGPIVRRRDVFELTRVRPVTYRFMQPAGDTLHLVVFVVTPGENADFRVRYTIEGAKPASRQGAFFRRVTLPDGVLAGRGGDLARGALWEGALEAQGTDGVARAVIRLGDDLQPGERVVRLDLQPPAQEEKAKRVWVGAVLVGQKGPAQVLAPRIWIEDDQ